MSDANQPVYAKIILMKTKPRNNKSKKQPQSQWDVFWAPLAVPLSRFNKKIRAKKYDGRVTTILFLVALALPFVAWAFGAVSNPSGWMSDNPFIGYFHVVMYLQFYWYISVPVFFGVMLFVILFKLSKSMYARVWSYVVFVASLILSILVYTAVESANESEFTG